MKTKLLTILLASILFACNNKKIEKPEVLYQKALKATYKGNFETASRYLSQIDENYPYTEYATNSLILLSYVNYKKGEYSELIPIVDIFIKTNPRDDNVPYLLYLKGMSFYNQIKNHKKDKQILYEFIAINSQLSANFPNTEYARQINQKSYFVKNLIANGELDVAIQYQKKGDCTASVARYLEIMPFLEGKNKELAKANIKLCLDALGIKNHNF
jgi:outer membrane protein assembly factor BamD